MRLLLLTSLLLSALAPVRSADRQPNPPPVVPTRAELEKLGGFDPMPAAPEEFNLHVELLIADLPNADAFKLLQDFRNPAQAEAAYAALLEMLGNQKARLIAWPTLITKSGLRAVVENIDEIRYPIEFAGGGVALLSEIDSATHPSDEPAPSAPADPAAAPTPPKPAKTEDKGAPAPDRGIVQYDPAPTTFETRNAGITLEIEPNLDVQQMTIEAQLAPQRVFFAGMDKRTVEAGNRKVVVEQPHFITNKVSTNLMVKSGQHVLIGSFNSPDLAGWTELFIVQITARQPGKK